MKFFNIYKISVISLKELESVTINKIPNNINIYEIKNYDILKKELIKLKDIAFYTNYVNKLIDSIPILIRDKENPQIDSNGISSISLCLTTLKSKMNTVIELYDSFKLPKDNVGIDILMPELESLDEYSDCINDLNIIFKKYNLFKIGDKTAEYSFNDIGSSWMSLLIDPSIIKDFLLILVLVVEFSISFHHKINSLRLEKTLLDRSEIKTKLLNSELDFFEEMKKLHLEEAVKQMQSRNENLKNTDKSEIKSTLEKCEKWFDKGLKFYSSIDVDEEIAKVFPITEASYKLDMPKIYNIEDKQD